MQCASSITSIPAVPASRGQHPVAEAGIVQPLRADQQHVHLARGDLAVGLLPVVGVGGVDGPGADPGAAGGVDLVAHQRQQRRDDDRRARAPRAQQRGGDEVDGRLAPPGALHHQGAAAVQQGADRRPLVLPQPGVIAGQGPQGPLGVVAASSRRPGRGGGRAGRGGIGHAPIGTRRRRHFRPGPLSRGPRGSRPETAPCRLGLNGRKRRFPAACAAKTPVLAGLGRGRSYA